MCGIFGILSNQNIDKGKLLKVSSVLSHRGPDDEGYILFQNENMDLIEASGPDTIDGLQIQNILTINP